MIGTKEDAIRWLAEHGGRVSFRTTGETLTIHAEVPLDSGDWLSCENNLAPKWIEGNLAGVIKNCVGQLVSQIQEQGLKLKCESSQSEA